MISFTEFGDHDHEYFMVELRPTTKCNYNCFYCPDLHINTNKFIKINYKNVDSLIRHIKSITNKPVHLFICGGEPTLYPDFKNYISRLSKHLNQHDKITIQTNLTKDINWFKDFCTITTPCELYINPSYHKTAPGLRLTDYIKKCLYIKSCNMLGMISFSYTSRVCIKSDYLRARSTLGEEHCEIVPIMDGDVSRQAPQSLSKNEIDYLYNNEDINELESTGHFFKKNLNYKTENTINKISRAEMWFKRINKFNGYSCSVSRNKIYIDWDGNCYSCFNGMFSKTPAIFNINDSTFDIQKLNITQCIVCPYTDCFFDLEYKKISNPKNNQHVTIPINRKNNKRLL